MSGPHCIDAPLLLRRRVQEVQRHNPRPFNLAAVGVPGSNSIACASLVKQYDPRNHRGSRTSNSAVQLGVIHVIVSPMFASKTIVLLCRHRQTGLSLCNGAGEHKLQDGGIP
ncbi:hypothetical protein ACQJBY_059128 [Aegilops geniculata]